MVHGVNETLLHITGSDGLDIQALEAVHSQEADTATDFKDIFPLN